VQSVYEPDGPSSDILGALVATRLSEYPALRPWDVPRWYPLVWDLAFKGGWPWEQSRSARAAGRRLVKLPPRVRDYGVALLAAAITRLRPRPDHVLVKSVNVPLALEWVARRYAPKVVVLRRNPLSVVSSWFVLGWTLRRPLEDIAVVRERYLEPFNLRPPAAAASPLTRSAWNVGLLMTALKCACEQHPDWIVASHDALCLDPRAGFQDLYARLGLEWTPAVDDYLALSDRPGFVVFGRNAQAHPNARTATEPSDARREQQASQWQRRLSRGQVEEVEAVLEGFPLGAWRAPA
jgi:hypothetical protein